MKIFLIANGKVHNIKHYFDNIKPNLVIAVNGGTNKSIKNSITPNIIIGDNDSIRKKSKSQKIKYPKDKDKNDLDLAIEYLLSNYTNFQLFCFGILGNRIDHTLSNLNSISKITPPPIIIHSKQTILILNPSFSLKNIPTKTKVSIISLTKFSKVNIKGYKYSGNYEIPFLSSLGISNIVLNQDNEIHCKEGKIITIIYLDFIKFYNEGKCYNSSS